MIGNRFHPGRVASQKLSVMSKGHRKYSQIREIEKKRALKQLSEKWNKDHGSDGEDPSAPSVENLESVVSGTKSADQATYDVTNLMSEFVEYMDHDNDTDYKEVSRRLRIIKAATIEAIARIETNW